MDELEKQEYELMMELEQMETLKEEMEELGVTSLAEVEARMRELNQKLDRLRQEDHESASRRGDKDARPGRGAKPAPAWRLVVGELERRRQGAGRRRRPLV